MKVDFFEVNGFRVANIHVEGGLSCFGIAVLSGCQYEEPSISGIAHFTEHMFFKGTTSKSWYDINRLFGRLGAKQNAYTSNNEVVYYAGFPNECAGGVIEVMMDMFFNSSIPEDELEKERKVIIEEKKRSSDDPISHFYDEISSNFFAWNRGHPTLGTMESISAISRDDIMKYMEKHSNFSNVMFIFVGDCTDFALARYVHDNIPIDHPYSRQGKRNEVDGLIWSDLNSTPGMIKMEFTRDNMTQSNVALMFDGLQYGHPLQYALRILIKAIGGGMYSKLFTRIREELGLCYSVWMSYDYLTFPDVQILNVGGGMSPKNVRRFIDEVEVILTDVAKNGIDEDLFRCARMDMISSILMSTESSMGKLSIFTKPYLFGIPNTLETLLEGIRNVTVNDCNEVAKMVLLAPHNWAIMNPSVDK
jgi:predicted Zn-dependent peptidase